jgi:hypothetical protein
MNFRSQHSALLGLVALAAACSSAPSPDATPTGSTSEAVKGSCAIPVVESQSLFVASVDDQGNANLLGAAVLQNFSFKSVMEQIVSTGAAGSGLTALELYRQMVNEFNSPPCTGTINGFPVDCPRPEGALAGTNPFGGGKDAVTPVALVNRLDLAPSNGSNCGEYRVVFAIPSPVAPVSRFLMIFEATLPNPAFPAQGVEACLPVAQLWDNLSAPGISQDEFVANLTQFYFEGIPGLPGNPAFPPVIQAQNYGVGGPNNTNTGQIRTNMLSIPTEGEDVQWQLREFTLSQNCVVGGSGGQVCSLLANNTFVKDNPFGALFEAGNGTTFQSGFVDNVKSLAAGSIPLISMTTPNGFNAGQSSEQDDTNDYGCQAGVGRAQGDFLCAQETENTSLEAAIQTELDSIGNTQLTPADIIQRATTQSCAGCHQLSPGTSLGGGLKWPASEGFTQVNEQGQQSTALRVDFLPFRSKVLTSFIDKHCGASPDAGTDSGTEQNDGLTISGRAAGSSE